MAKTSFAMILTVMIIYGGAGRAYAANPPAFDDPVMEDVLLSSSNTKSQQVPAHIQPYIYLTQIPYVYSKGGSVYPDFPGLPDFAHFAKLDGDRVAIYPADVSGSFYLGTPDVGYEFRKQIIDYITNDADKLKAYKAYIQALGFINVKQLGGGLHPEYANSVLWELKYDAEFSLDADGIFIIESIETFGWLLIGKSITYNSTGDLTPCVEFRFYTLKRSAGSSRSILSETGNLSNVSNPASYAVPMYTPNAVDDIY